MKAMRLLADQSVAALEQSGYDDAVLDTRWPAWQQIVDDVIVPVVVDVYARSYDQTLGTLTAAAAPSHAAMDNATAHVATVRNRLVGVGDDVFDLVRGTLNEGRATGESIPKLAARVEGTLQANGTATWRGRGATVARTEVIGAHNAGAHGAATATAETLGHDHDEVVREVEAATLDARVRETHAAADGQQVTGMATLFAVGDAALQYPGDPAGPSEEVINCRCTCNYLMPGDPGYPDELAGAVAQPIPERPWWPVTWSAAPLRPTSSPTPTGPPPSPRNGNKTLHKNALIRRLNDSPVCPAPNFPTFNLLGGGPASGKSVFTKANPEAFANSAVVNADDFKTLLPEYEAADGTFDAAFVHEESSYLTKKALSYGYDRGFSMTLDGTGDGSTASLTRKIGQARGAGYQVNGYYVTVDTETAVARAAARGAKTGRYVPEVIIRKTHDKVSEVFPKVADRFDTLQLVDTSTRPSTLVAQKTAGSSIRIMDHEAYARFVAKAEAGSTPTCPPPPPTVGASTPTTGPPSTPGT